jgi:hypothetical protein
LLNDILFVIHLDKLIGCNSQLIGDINNCANSFKINDKLKDYGQTQDLDSISYQMLNILFHFTNVYDIFRQFPLNAKYDIIHVHECKNTLIISTSSYIPVIHVHECKNILIISTSSYIPVIHVHECKNILIMSTSSYISEL